jgi:hypothetical protein
LRFEIIRGAAIFNEKNELVVLYAVGDGGVNVTTYPGGQTVESNFDDFEFPSDDRIHILNAKALEHYRTGFLAKNGPEITYAQ